MSKWPQDQYTRCNIYKMKKKKSNPHYISQNMNTPLSPKLSLPL